eukprot:PhM_4_TR8440/c2_g1_i4/m.51227
MTAECILHVHTTANKLLRHVLGLRIEFSNPDLHTHTEELYTTTPFIPLAAHASLLRQWGHWVRASDRRPTLDPVISVLAGTTLRDRPIELSARRPSQNLRQLLSTATEYDLLELPLNRSVWRRTCAAAYRRLAKQMARWISDRRLRSDDEEGYSYDWNPRIESWISDAQSREKA